MRYGTDLSFRKLSEDENASVIVCRTFPMIERMLEKNPAAAGLALKKLSQYAPQLFSVEAMEKLDKELKEYGRTKGLTPKEQEKAARYQQMEQERRQHAGQAESSSIIQDCFWPGQVWKDTNGNRIQAHGGAIFYENGTYYWYGENKEFTDGKSDIWTWGIRAYRSKDLYNWEDLGLIISPETANPDSNLFPDMHLDRPHIVKCRATGKYAAWLKLSGAEACFLIMQADHFLGPYEIVRENYRPFGSEVGDFDIVQDEQAKKAYLYMDADHKRIAGYELSADCLSAEREISSQYENMPEPFCREGIAVFERNGKKYMLTSGMTGYIPNQSDAAVAQEWTDSFQSIGDPHVADLSRASFNSQFTQIFRMPEKEDLYIALADRWMPEYPVDARRADLVRRCIAHRQQPQEYPVTEDEQREFAQIPALEQVNTSVADYVWLPLIFDGDKVRICWKDFWKWEDER